NDGWDDLVRTVFFDIAKMDSRPPDVFRGAEFKGSKRTASNKVSGFALDHASSPSRERTLAYVALGVVYIVWGSTYVGIRLVVAHMPPFVAAAMRFLIAGSALLLFTLVRGNWRKPSREQFKNAVI